jgi:hypothetical protein
VAAAVGAECESTLAKTESSSAIDQDPPSAKGSDSLAGSAAGEAAEAEAKASIAYIKSSPDVREAWIAWLGAQETADGGPRAAEREGLAAVGFDPARHSQETRGSFCAQHGASQQLPGAGAASPLATGVLPGRELPVVSDGGVRHLILIGVHAHNRFTGPAAM